MADASSWGLRARSLEAAGRYDEAEAVLRDGLKRLPRHPVLSYALGILLLARGAFAEGWELYEFRRFMPRGPTAPKLSFPEWNGASIRSLLVLPEQGSGDQIMFARFLPALRTRGIDVTLVTPPALARLLAPLVTQVVVVDGTAPVPACDAWCFLGSLPRSLGDIPPPPPYLPGAITDSDEVGLMLHGDTVARQQQLPPKGVIDDLLKLGRSLHPADTGVTDFQGTADIIKSLGLVVSVDTAVAHLAAAMGKPTWILLPERADWRWGREPAPSLWYPDAQLFRQQRGEEWVGVAERVQAAKLTSQRTRRTPPC